MTPFEVCHSVPCLGYTIERGGKKFVFCTDHELRHGGDADDPRRLESEAAEARLIEQAQGADVLYRDAQFLREEYDGRKGIGASNPVSRRDWGHSCIEDVLKMAEACGVKQTYLGHHDPNREWSERTELDRRVQKSSNASVELAIAGTVIDL